MATLISETCDFMEQYGSSIMPSMLQMELQHHVLKVYAKLLALSSVVAIKPT